MKRIAFLIASLALCGLSPLNVQHDSQKKVDDEFVQAYNGLQSKRFRVVTTTPNYSDLEDGEMVIYSSGALKIMFRSGVDIYAVNFSCITVRR